VVAIHSVGDLDGPGEPLPVCYAFWSHAVGEADTAWPAEERLVLRCSNGPRRTRSRAAKEGRHLMISAPVVALQWAEPEFPPP
jgi:hypothetical protein